MLIFFKIDIENCGWMLASGPSRSLVHFMVPYSRNERFIAGGQKSSRIREKLAERKPGHHRRLAIYGLGGVGYTNSMGGGRKRLADWAQENSRRT